MRDLGKQKIKKAGDTINFGTTSDGWRGILALDFTFSNVAAVANAIAQYAKKELPGKGIVVGYDTRFMSKDFAEVIATCIQKHKIDTYISDSCSPTPSISFITKTKNHKCGINVTASHNPPKYNGIKLRLGYGGTPKAEQLNKIERLVPAQSREIPKITENIKETDIIAPYVEGIRQMVKPGLSKQVAVLVDSMHGTTTGILDKVFSADKNITVTCINNTADPYFGKTPPEPKFESTAQLQQDVRTHRYNLGIAHDGDGDRIIAVTPNRGYISPHSLSAALLFYLVKYRKLGGLVLGSDTLGRQLKKVANHFCLPYEEFPVGFKNATLVMLEKAVLIAAEENGGIGFGFYLPERDASLTAALVVEAETIVENGFEGLLSQMEEIAGKSGFCRQNYIAKTDRKLLFRSFEESILESGLGTGVIYKSFNSGLKLIWPNENSAIVRISGTENLLRIYAESDTRNSAVEIARDIAKKLEKIEGK